MLTGALAFTLNSRARARPNPPAVRASRAQRKGVGLHDFDLEPACGCNAGKPAADGHFCGPTLGHTAVANISERQASEGGAFVLHWPGLPGPEAAGTTVGLRVVKNEEEQSSNSERNEGKKLLHIGSYAFSSAL
jgi:hypothetical protein